MEKVKSLVLSAILLLALGLNINAQQENKEVKTIPFQLSQSPQLV